MRQHFQQIYYRDLSGKANDFPKKQEGREVGKA